MVSGPPTFFFPAMEVNGDQQLFGYQYSLKCPILCSTEERNSYTGLKQNEGEYILIFFKQYPFNYISSLNLHSKQCSIAKHYSFKNIKVVSQMTHFALLCTHTSILSLNSQVR